MADSEKPKPPESPTTARELDFDDEEEINLGSPKPKTAGTPIKPAGAAAGAEEGAAPQQPPRPLSPREQAENTLKEAFPSIDAAVVRAVLSASGGQVEPAFNALLGMSDPNAAQHEAPPPQQPPRPMPQPRSQQLPPGMSQVEQDEIYARRLAQHYQHQDDNVRFQQQRGQDPRLAQQAPNQMGYYDDDEDRERSFIDDDLPVIRENIRKGFLETQSKVNSFISNLRKKIDGEDEDEEEPPPPPPRRPTQQQPGRAGDMGRRSGDHARYDADPHVLGDDFTELQLTDETVPKPGSRPSANPDLFKPTPATPGSGGGGGSERKVAFQQGPPETIDDSLYGDDAKRASKSKWQPLSSVDPDPVAEHDPFSLGDSDDDEQPKKKDPKPDDAARLQKATAEAMADDITKDDAKKDEEAAKKD